MCRPALSVVILIALAAGVSLSFGVAQGSPPIDVFFAAVLYGAALLVGRVSWLAFRAASRQRRVAAGLDGIDAAQAATLAVLEERRRLSQNIEASLRDSIARISGLAAALVDDADPRARLASIQAETVRATNDLRRQLGLLRAEDEALAAEPEGAGHSAGRLRLGDCVFTVVALVLAGVDLAILNPLEHRVPTLPETALTLSSAVTIAGRRIAPETASLVCAGILALGAVIDQPVLDGFGLALTMGTLAWSCAALATLRPWLVLVGFVGCGLASRLVNQPENAAILMVILTGAVTGGATFGRGRRQLGLARSRAEARERELAVAAADAVAAERRMVARELHDVVSHAISVIAVQAGAAEMSWPIDAATSRRAIDVVTTVAHQTLADLDRLRPGRITVNYELSDLRSLVDRMRAAGLDVTLDLGGEACSPMAPTIYRVVQETLTNALRHAPGSRVHVAIEWTGECATVKVADDGPGPTPAGRRGYGLIGLAERLRLAGGTLTVRSAPDVPGFEVTAVLPDETVVGAP